MKIVSIAPKDPTVNASYGSEENYALLEQKQLESFVKFNMFDKQQNTHYNQKYPFAANQLFYHEQKDAYI